MVRGDIEKCMLGGLMNNKTKLEEEKYKKLIFDHRYKYTTRLEELLTAYTYDELHKIVK